MEIKKRTLFIVTSLNVGGIEKYLLRLITHTNGNLNSTVLCKHGFTGHLYNSYKENGANIITLRLGYFSFLNYIKLYFFLKKERFDSVCDFTGDFAGLPLFIARLAGVKNRIVFYRISHYQFKKSFFRLLYIKCIRLALKAGTTLYLSNSKEAFNNFHKNWKAKTDKFKVIYNGVVLGSIINSNKSELKTSLGIPENAFVIGHVGSFRTSKNHKFIMEVAKDLCSKYNDVYFLICGRGTHEGLGEWILNNKLSDKIVLAGNRDDIPDMLSIMNVFFFPSLHEGQPNAMIEAILAGIPVLASDINTIQESLPENMRSIIAHPLNEEIFVQQIERIKLQGNQYPVDELRSWAEKTFDPNIRFNEVFEVLIN